jgi:hypothetical protein
LIKRFRTPFLCNSAILGRFWTVFRAKEIGKAGIEITCPAYHWIGQSRKGRDLPPFSTQRFQLRVNEFEDEVEGDCRDDIVGLSPL